MRNLTLAFAALALLAAPPASAMKGPQVPLSAELITEDSPEWEELEWRIVRRYHNSDEDARRYQAWSAVQGPGALIAVSLERIIGWNFN